MSRRPLFNQPSSLNIRASERRGAMLVAVLVCLLVVMAILGSMLKGTMRAHRQLHRERDRRQTELLLQAGNQRAFARFGKDANYAGETWSLPADAFGGKGAGQVTIAIASPDGQSARTVQIIAEYPVGGETSIRRSRNLQLPPPRPNEQE